MASEQRLLEVLGRRLRRAREEAGRSLAAAARAAGLSRRHLTEIEAGRANPSYLVLVRLATELGVSLEIAPRRAVAGSGRLALVGLRGAGKTSVGRRVARSLERPFVELDARVEALASLSLGEIFAVHGEAGFARYEAEALEAVLAEVGHAVIAPGGSVVNHPETFERLLETCRTVWLRATPEEHMERVRAQGDPRPMRNRPRAMEELRALLAEREPLYARCTWTVDTSGRDAEDVAREVLELVGREEGA